MNFPTEAKPLEDEAIRAALMAACVCLDFAASKPELYREFTETKRDPEDYKKSLIAAREIIQNKFDIPKVIFE